MKLPMELKMVSELDRLEKENSVLRGVIANADLPCMYCGLSKDDMAKCAFGFPGCSRADDITNDPNFDFGEIPDDHTETDNDPIPT